MASRTVALVSYASPDLIPANLRKVGVVSGTAPENTQRVTPNWVVSPAIAPANQACFGAVTYATRDLVPARLLALGLEGDLYGRILGTSGLIAYWPMDEASGATAFDNSGNARNGAYTGVTLGQEGIGDGRTCPLFAGGDMCNVYSTSLRDAFNGAEGTVLAWAKVADVANWTDGTLDYIHWFSADGNNYVRLLKNSTSNQLVFTLTASNVFKQVVQSGVSTVNWFALALTWSLSADQMKAFNSGVQVGATQTGLGTWVGLPATTGAIVGAGTTTPTNPWSGPMAHAALFNRALSAAEIASLSVV